MDRQQTGKISVGSLAEILNSITGMDLKSDIGKFTATILGEVKVRGLKKCLDKTDLDYFYPESVASSVKWSKNDARLIKTVNIKFNITVFAGCFSGYFEDRLSGTDTLLCYTIWQPVILHHFMRIIFKY